MALEVLGEGRTPLLLQELVAGSSRLKYLRLAVFRMSLVLLSKSLTEFELRGSSRAVPPAASTA
jgi:hypothetical protein